MYIVLQKLLYNYLSLLMPQIYDIKKNKSERHYLTSHELEVLKNKLKLSNDDLELLLNSKGSIKNKSFFDSVSETLNNNER